MPPRPAPTQAHLAPTCHFKLFLLRSLLVAAALLAHGGTSARAQDDAEGPGRIPGGQMIRGVVTRVAAPDSLAVKTETGDTVLIATTTNTRVLKGRQPAKLSDLHVGDGVGAAGVLDPATHTLHAAFLGAIDAEDVRRAQAELGKSYILGRITAINELHLTIHRPDGVNQVIAVDEGTSFRRGGHIPNSGFGPGTATPPPDPSRASQGESITLADLKVGDTIGARGSIKAGIFTPTELHVGTGHPHRTDSATGTGERSDRPDHAGAEQP